MIENRQIAMRDNNQPVAEPNAYETRAMFHLIANTMRLWWPVAVVFGILASCFAAGGVYLTFQPEYKASMWLRIYKEAPYIVFESKGSSSQFVENQTQLIRSRLVLGPLISDPAIANLEELSNSLDKIEALANRLVVRPVGKSEYFAVEYHGIDRETSKQVVQRVVNSYMSLQNSDESQHRQNVMVLLESEKAVREKKVEELRLALSQIIEESAVIEDDKSKFTEEQLTSLADLRRRMVELDVESAILKIEIEAFDNSRDRQKFIPDGRSSYLTVDDHPQLRAAEIEIEKLENRLHADNSIGSGHPAYKLLLNELDRKKNRLGQIREKLAKRQQDSLQFGAQSDWDKQLETMKLRLASYNITREVVEAHIATNTGSIKKSTGDSLQAEFLRAELGQATEVHDLISRRLLALKTEQRAPARVRPLEAGGVTAIPGEITPFKKMAVVSAGAFAIPFVLLFGLEFWMRRVSTASQLKEVGHLDVVGEIANLPNPSLTRHIRPHRWAVHEQLYRESVDHLRTNLACQATEQAVQVIAVASAVSGEGKTSLALQLSKSLASATGKRVLLIDGDTRYPNLHHRTNADLSPGLVEVLEKTSSWDSAVRQLNGNGHHLLAAGELNASPHRLFGGNDFNSLLDQLRKSFRYIIVDTPPVLSASESLVMTKAADAVLFCVRRDRSRLNDVHCAHDRLLQAGIGSVGTVLTGVPFRNYTSKYGVYTYPDKNSVSTGSSVD